MADWGHPGSLPGIDLPYADGAIGVSCRSIDGIDAGIVLRPRESGFIGPVRVESRHFRVEAGNDLDGRETLGQAICKR
jgi:hypothetical protein